MNKRFLTVIFLVAFLITWIPAVSAETAKNKTCPVMPGEKVKDHLYVDYQGRRVYLCCASCVKAFPKNPEKYLKNLNAQP